MKIYTGEEVHGFMLPDYKADEPRWIDVRELEPALLLIVENSRMVREPLASMKSIELIVRQILGKCPYCGVQYVMNARHFSECKLNPGELAPPSSLTTSPDGLQVGQWVQGFPKDIDDFPGPEDFGLPNSGEVNEG